jgi:hypothetical protein
MGRLLIAASVAWIIGWVVFFIYLTNFERPKPIDYLTFACIVLGPPGVLGLIGWVAQAFRAKP